MGDTQIKARVPTPLAVEFKEVCAADDRLVSQVLRRLIRDYVEEAQHANGGPEAAAARKGTSGPSADG